VSFESSAGEQAGVTLRTARSCVWGIALTLLAGCGCAQSNGPTDLAPGASARAVACPLGIEGARVTVADSADGVELTITADPVHAAEVRSRARDAAALRGIGAHKGQGHDGKHLGAHRHGLRLTALPPVNASVEDVDGGARIRLAAVVPEQVEALRERARENVEAASKPPCEF